VAAAGARACIAPTGRRTRSPHSAGHATCCRTSSGIDPGPALRGLEAEVLAQSPALSPALSPLPPAATAAGPRRRHPPPPASPPTGHPRCRLGIHAAVRRCGVRGPARPRRPRRRAGAIRTAVADLAAGASQLLLIEGPPGVGKTRLLAEGPPAGRRARPDRARRARQPARTDLRLRRGAAAVRADAGRRRTARSGCSPARRPAPAGCSTCWTSRPRARSRCCTGSTGWPPASPPSGRWCWRSTTCSGATPPRCGSSSTSPAGSTGCRCCCSRRCGPASGTRTTTCSPRSCSTRPPRWSGRGRSAGRGRPSWSAGRLGEPAPLFLTACHTTTAGNPLLLRQLLRALEGRPGPAGRPPTQTG
jgi:hypothetical protein